MSNLRVVPFVGAPMGANLDVSQHELPDNMALYIQDALLDQPGVIRIRGPVTTTAHNSNPDFPTLPASARCIGIASLPDPANTSVFRVLVLAQNLSDSKVRAYIYGRGPDISDWKGTRLAVIQLGAVTIGGTDTLPFFDAKPSLDGGLLFGIGVNYGKDTTAARRGLWHWRGAGKQDYTTGSLTWTQSSKVVTGSATSFLANVEPGMFLLDGTGRYLGTVASVDSNTQITLESNVLAASAVGQLYTLTSIRTPFTKNFVNAGSITVASGATTVNGGDTKFQDQGIANNDLVFKASDFTFVGKVSSVASNTQLTLQAGSTVAMSNDNYLIVALSATAPNAYQVPILPAYWSGMQFLANADNMRNGKNERMRIWVLGPDLVDEVDLTSTGTFIDMPSVKSQAYIKGLMPTESALLVLLPHETYGLYGNTPDTLVPKPILLDDGCLSPMTIQPWKGGAIWTGTRGIYLFDGTSATNLLEGRMAHAHQEAISGLDYSQYRAWSMVYNDHYIVHLEKINTGVFDYEQGGVSYAPTHLIYCINLRSGAISFFTNVSVRGFTQPSSPVVNAREGYYMVEDASTSGPAICSAEALFVNAFGSASQASSSGPEDYILTNPDSPTFAPHFFLETKLYDFGDPQLLKMFKQVQLHHMIKGTTVPGTEKLNIDVIVGLTKTATALTAMDKTTIGTSPVWVNSRTKFLKRATHLGLRLYTDSASSVGIVIVGPWALGFKPQRPGRV